MIGNIKDGAMRFRLCFRWHMKVTENENKEIVKKVREGLERTGGYCPCRIQRTPENKCMCEEFKRQIADPDFEGYCHCMLYYKSK